MEGTTIKIHKQTLELFNMFYHDASYAGELRIHILDKILIGGKHSTLNLVMEKEIGKFGSINNSFYKFYLEFVNVGVESRRNPYTKKLPFKSWPELYAPIVDDETLQNIILNCIDKPAFDTFSIEFFNEKIVFVIVGYGKTKDCTSEVIDDIIKPEDFM